MEFTMSDLKHGLFKVLSTSATPAEKGGELIMHLLTNNADSKKGHTAAVALLDYVAKQRESMKPKEFQAFMLKAYDVTVGKPKSDKSATQGCELKDADCILQYKTTTEALVKRAEAIVNLFACDIPPIVIKEGTKTAQRKMGGSLAAGLAD